MSKKGSVESFNVSTTNEELLNGFEVLRTREESLYRNLLHYRKTRLTRNVKKLNLLWLDLTIATVIVLIFLIGINSQ